MSLAIRSARGLDGAEGVVGLEAADAPADDDAAAPAVAGVVLVVVVDVAEVVMGEFVLLLPPSSILTIGS